MTRKPEIATLAGKPLTANMQEYLEAIFEIVDSVGGKVASIANGVR